MLGWGLILITFGMAIIGVGFYYEGSVGWAQLFWVLASGTAGAGVMALIDDR